MESRERVESVRPRPAPLDPARGHAGPRCPQTGTEAPQSVTFWRQFPNDTKTPIDRPLPFSRAAGEADTDQVSPSQTACNQNNCC